MGCVVCGKEIDTEVVQRKCEGDGYSYLGPKARGVLHRSEAVWLEVADEALIDNDAGFI